MTMLLTGALAAWLLLRAVEAPSILRARHRRHSVGSVWRLYRACSNAYVDRQVRKGKTRVP